MNCRLRIARRSECRSFQRKKLRSIDEFVPLILIFMSTIWTFKFASAVWEFGFLWQEEVRCSPILKHRMRKYKVAVVAPQSPSRHIGSDSTVSPGENVLPYARYLKVPEYAIAQSLISRLPSFVRERTLRLKSSPGGKVRPTWTTHIPGKQHIAQQF